MVHLAPYSAHNMTPGKKSSAILKHYHKAVQTEQQALLGNLEGCLKQVSNPHHTHHYHLMWPCSQEGLAGVDEGTTVQGTRLPSHTQTTETTIYVVTLPMTHKQP